MKISYHSDFLDVSMEQTFYLPSIIFLTIFNKKKKEPLFERDFFENLKKDDLINIKEEIDIIKRKSTKFKLKPHIQIPLKSKIKSHKWFLFKDRDSNYYFFLIDRLICEKISFRFYQKIKGRLKNTKKNVQLLKQRKILNLKINEIFDKVNEMPLGDNVSSYSCFNSTINSDFSLKHTRISFKGKIDNKIKKDKKNDENSLENNLEKIIDFKIDQKNNEIFKGEIMDENIFDKNKVLIDIENNCENFEEMKKKVYGKKEFERENKILYMKIVFTFSIGFAVVLWILQYLTANKNIYKAFK